MFIYKSDLIVQLFDKIPQSCYIYVFLVLNLSGKTVFCQCIKQILFDVNTSHDVAFDFMTFPFYVRFVARNCVHVVNKLDNNKLGDF